MAMPSSISCANRGVHHSSVLCRLLSCKHSPHQCSQVPTAASRCCRAPVTQNQKHRSECNFNWSVPTFSLPIIACVLSGVPSTSWTARRCSRSTCRSARCCSGVTLGCLSSFFLCPPLSRCLGQFCLKRLNVRLAVCAELGQLLHLADAGLHTASIIVQRPRWHCSDGGCQF